MAYDEHLAGRVRAQLGSRAGVVEKKMFGGVGFMLQGNLACGVNKDELIVRVGPERYEGAVMRPHARPFDFTGRPMKGWVMVGPAALESDEALSGWVDEGVAFALSLPPK